MMTRTRYPSFSANTSSVLLLGVPAPGTTAIAIKKSKKSKQAKQVQETVQPVHDIMGCAFRVEFGTNLVNLWHPEWPLSATGRNLYEVEQEILAQARALAESMRHGPITADQCDLDLQDFLSDVF